MAYIPPVTPDIIFNFITPEYVAPVTPDIIFEMTTEDDDGGGSKDPRTVQIFVIT